MKHQYFGDVNDYVKYGLLRCFAAAGFEISVCWMLTPDDTQGDGGKVDYLGRPEAWRQHDPLLFDYLSNRLLDGVGKRLDETWLQRGRFFSKVVPDTKRERLRWFDDALSALEDSDLLFFDPDNGIEVPSTPMGWKNSSKYVFWSELQLAWTKTSSLLVFQHFSRKGRVQYTQALVTEMELRLEGATVLPLASSNVLFLYAYRELNRPRVSAILALVEANWGGRLQLTRT